MIRRHKVHDGLGMPRWYPNSTHYSTLRRLPLGAGIIRGMYVTVLVTTSRTCRMLPRDGIVSFASAVLDLSAVSQLKNGRVGCALKGDRMLSLRTVALMGEFGLENAGLGGSFRLGNEAAPTGGADKGAWAGYGLRGTMSALSEGRRLPVTVGAEEASSVLTAFSCGRARDGADVGEILDVGESEAEDATTGESRAITLERKSVYADGGLIGVLTYSGHFLTGNVAADRGLAAVEAEAISDGKVAVAGVESFSSLSFGAGMVSSRVLDC